MVDWRASVGEALSSEEELLLDEDEDNWGLEIWGLLRDEICAGCRECCPSEPEERGPEYLLVAPVIGRSGRRCVVWEGDEEDSRMFS